MKIQNNYIEDLAQFLLSMKLKGTENRMRNRFVKILQEHLKVLQEDHKALLNEYCKKDENGEFKTVTKDANTYYDINDTRGFQREFQILMEEYLYIPNDDTHSPIINTVKDIILSCDKEFSGSEALRYESYCEMFEESETVVIQ